MDNFSNNAVNERLNTGENPAHFFTDNLFSLKYFVSCFTEGCEFGRRQAILTWPALLMVCWLPAEIVFWTLIPIMVFSTLDIFTSCTCVIRKVLLVSHRILNKPNKAIHNFFIRFCGKWLCSGTEAVVSSLSQPQHQQHQSVAYLKEQHWKGSVKGGHACSTQRTPQYTAETV